MSAAAAGILIPLLSPYVSTLRLEWVISYSGKGFTLWFVAVISCFFELTGRLKMKTEAWPTPFLHFRLQLWTRARFRLNMISRCLNGPKRRRTALVGTDWNHLDLTHDSTDSQCNGEFRVCGRPRRRAWSRLLNSKLNDFSERALHTFRRCHNRDR